MKARALVDLAGTGIKSGEFFEAPDVVVKGLVASGDADVKATEAAVYPDGGAPAAKQHPAMALATASKVETETTSKK